MSDLDVTELINKIKTRRLELNMSYQDLSDSTGLSKSTLQRYETGFIKKVPINQIPIIAQALRINPAYLMGWSEEKLPPLQSEDACYYPLNPSEQLHITKYRALTSENQTEIDHQIDFKLYVQEKEGK